MLCPVLIQQSSTSKVTKKEALQRVGFILILSLLLSQSAAVKALQTGCCLSESVFQTKWVRQTTHSVLPEQVCANSWSSRRTALLSLSQMWPVTATDTHQPNGEVALKHSLLTRWCSKSAVQLNDEPSKITSEKQQSGLFKLCFLQHFRVVFLHFRAHFCVWLVKTYFS